MIEKPVYSEIVYGKCDDESVVDEQDNMISILKETGGYLTVLSSTVIPISETALDKLNLNTSSSDSIVKLSSLAAVEENEDSSD